MAITGTGHQGATQYSLEEGVLTITGPGGKAEVRVGDMLEYRGEVVSFNPLAGHAIVKYTMWGQTERREVPLGELHVTDALMVD